ncbi:MULTISPECIES: protein-glutamate O-methylesterase CheB [Rhizobium]|jgi:two-component system chemotaxis response regulator CheB|uniref:Protein-glutamate methylesterase/protein-glutamine glutaminase n=1 Tax=Rhizobium anhuiense TaxID=1184720 RepID=A0A3S0QJP8_9HYPH|nr:MULTISPECIES: protein-glutamate O-methylesterase CheB [Rhizobium]KZS49279.1 chemotaxis response regulator protein-glutamate methylesterase [Rhizobium anhuiense bv. trifolii]MBB3297443.1 two-component system chemotaxis response regulator CheB [Rhizobium sp. BK112]MBB3367160.1 two-component system chemotaxis response regulator CheB [Rhizobium sp. BK077]MBB3744796.1 two-component system chemotaxis response regulator CheB [Rhizobium sp. BK591]MBB4116205.1 two-component system chemotaxis respons
MSAPARVLVVDDSPTMRGLITAVLSSDPEVNVIGQAGDALEAREAIKRLNPDVVTLDIEMPNMNGLDFLEKIMTLRPMPVIMVSTMTHRGAEATLAALEIGAFDCVGKPGPGELRPFGDLAEKVKAAARTQRQFSQPTAAPTPPPSVADFRVGRKIVAIGSSTGGVEALIAVLQKFPANCPPTVITQHMPPTFTKSFAERLNRLCAPVVQEATDGARLEIGKIYLAPGGERHLQVSGASAPSCRLVDRAPVNGHRPSVDVLFDSVAELAGRNAVGVILTGMGRDGAAGLLKMRHAGARTLGQNEKTCVVYGMPRVAHELGAVEQQLPLSAIGEEILKMTAARKEGTE